MNRSLRDLNIQACGYRLSELKSILWFIESRHLANFDISSFIFSSSLEVHWSDQLEYLRHIITRRTALEQRRVQEENEIIEAKYTPPPILRPVLQTKNQESMSPFSPLLLRGLIFIFSHLLSVQVNLGEVLPQFKKHQNISHWKRWRN
jgi:hypothetical protein